MMVTIESLSYHDEPRHNYDSVTMVGIISRWMTVGSENDDGFGPVEIVFLKEKKKFIYIINCWCQ